MPALTLVLSRFRRAAAHKVPARTSLTCSSSRRRGTNKMRQNGDVHEPGDGAREAASPWGQHRGTAGGSTPPAWPPHKRLPPPRLLAQSRLFPFPTASRAAPGCATKPQGDQMFALRFSLPRGAGDRLRAPKAGQRRHIPVAAPRGPAWCGTERCREHLGPYQNHFMPILSPQHHQIKP